MEMNEELAMCAKINFDNYARAFPPAEVHPYFILAMAQLTEALGGETVEESLAERTKE